MEKVGKEGVITVEDGQGLQDELEVVEGMQFDRGYLSPYFINNPDRQISILDNPYILLHDKRSPTFANCCRFWSRSPRLAARCLSLLRTLTAKRWQPSWSTTFRGILKTCAVKAPGFGDRRKAMLEDIAI
jgi:chaperonin GroEL